MSTLRVPLSLRIATAIAVAYLLLLALVGALVHHQFTSSLRAELDARLQTTAATLLGQPLRAGELPSLPDDHVLQVVRADEVTSTSDPELDTPLLGPVDRDKVLGGEEVLATTTADDDQLRVLGVRSGDDRVVIVGAELDELSDAQEALVESFGPVALAGAGLAGLLGYVIARRGLAPIRRMSRDAEAIGGSDLSRRLTAPVRHDEVGRLAATLNGMLARVEAGVTRERVFTSDASHELRTPLAILRAELELTRQSTSDPALRRSLDSALEECGRLTALVEDLLVLARTDAGPLVGQSPVDLGELVEDVVTRFGTLASGKDVTLRTAGSAVISGDARSLDRAVSNLVDNAVRHTPSGGAVRVEVSAPGRETGRVTVVDTGPGVPQAELGRLFDRFTRVDGARQEPGGAGLGLAIVAAVASAHRGRVSAVNDDRGGLRVTLELG